MAPYTVVVVATKGRPQELSFLLESLARQTVLPDLVVVSACDPGDVAGNAAAAGNVKVLFGSPGLPAQRNRALSLVRDTCDIVIFFDDDFIPSRFWIEHVQMLMATCPDLVCMTGEVLRDGVKTGGFEWSCGRSIVERADLSSSRKAIVASGKYRLENGRTPYGCNMAFRMKSIRDLTFDERLLSYGWLEDLDFGARARARGKAIWSDAVWGVHLGSSRARTSGLRFGYSQVVNPWYLMQKRTMMPADVCKYILRALAANGLGLLALHSHVDRWGRLRGNLIGLKDILLRRWAPERIAELN